MRLAPDGPARIHVMLQTAGLPDEGQRKQLGALGVRLGEYLPQFTWFAAVPTARLAEVAKLEFVEAIVDIRPQDKIRADVLSDGMGPDARNDDGTLRVEIVFHHDVDVARMKQVVLDLGGSVRDAPHKQERLREGIRLHDEGDYDGAIVAYESILKDHPHDPTTVYELAFSWAQRGKDLEELTRFIEAELGSGIEQRPELPLVLGTAYDNLGQYAKGEAALRRAVKSVPDNPTLHYNLGVNLKLQERWADAAASFQEVLRRKADHASAWFGLGESLEKLDQPARALFARARAAALEPDSERGAGFHVDRCRGSIPRGVGE